jgi:hypothetical protein
VLASRLKANRTTAQMKSWDERERSWNRYRKEVEQPNQGKKLLRRIGGNLLRPHSRSMMSMT